MNKVFIVGNLARDPELRTTTSGISVCTMSVAVNRRFTPAGGEKQADFFSVIAWRALGENCAKYLAKGRKVAVSGALQTRQYDDKQGQKRYITEIVADDVEFLSPKGEGSGSSQSFDGSPVYSTDGLEETQGFTELDDSKLPF